MNHIPDYNFGNLIIICAAIQGFLFSLVVFCSKRYRDKAVQYLVWVIFLISINNLYYWIADTKLYVLYELTLFKYLLVPWDLLVLPMFYFFVASYLKKPEAIKGAYKIPFFVGLFCHVVLFFNRWLFWDLNVFPKQLVHSYFSVEEYAVIGFTIFVIMKTMGLIRSVQKEQAAITEQANPIKTTWLVHLLYAALGICLVWAGVLIFNYFFPDNVLNNRGKYYFIWIALSVLVYWLGYLGIYHLGLFHQRLFDSTSSSEASIKKSPKNKNLFNKIDSVIRDNRLYLDPNLSLSSLSNTLDMSEGYISQHINSFTNDNFSNYINGFRVEAAKSMLKDPQFDKYTIVSVALESGFNSKSSFYTAFKKHTGLSPSVYKSRGDQ